MTNYECALFHDYFAIRGGGERLALELARGLNATIIYGYRTKDTYDIADFPEGHVGIGRTPSGFLPGLASIELASRFASERKRAGQYKVRIFSGVASPFAAPDKESAGCNIFYCHTPPRFLYDQKAFFRSHSDLIRRLGQQAIGPIFRHKYEQAVGRMDVIVANSNNIKRRIKKHLGHDSVVVYPPVNTDKFGWREPNGYYLSTARLASLKRVRTIVEAFSAMPQHKLVVASGGEQEHELRKLAAGANNISFTGWVSDAEMKALIESAIATIYIPVEEDFGISPVESMAAGKPVIGVAEGGLLETIVHGKTGLLLPSDPSVANLQHAVGELTAEKARTMRLACEKQAQLFTRERFLSEMRSVIADAMARSTVR